MPNIFKTLVISVAVWGFSTLPAPAQQRKTIWSGIFNEEQAARGQKAFEGTCARCHLEDLSGKNGPALRGERFAEDWREANLGILFSTVKSMPPISARNPTPRLPEEVSLDILTYLLKANGAPAGPQELTIDALPSIQYEKQTGPEPVPNLSLVSIVGCLEQTSPAGWMLTRGTEPVRTMDSDVLSPAELAAGTTALLGTNSYRLSQVDYINKPIADYKDQRVQIKGDLVRQDQNQGARVNLMALETIAATCP